MRNLAVALLIGLAAVAVYLLASAGGEPAPVAPREAAVVEQGSDGATRRGAAGADDAAGADRSDAPSRETAAVPGGPGPAEPARIGAILAGRVLAVGAAGIQALPGAEVVLGTRRGSDATALTAVVTTTSGAAGAWRIELPADQMHGDLLIEARVAGRHGATEWLHVWPEPGQELEGLDLFVREVAPLRGRVVTADQVGVSGARVRAELAEGWRGRRSGPVPNSAYMPKPSARIESGAGGRFELLDLAVDRGWTVSARDGDRQGMERIDRIDPLAAPLAVVLSEMVEEAGVRVFGFVSGAGGRPLQGVTVTATHGGQTEGRTDDRGAFELTVKPSYGACFVTATADGFGVVLHEIPKLEGDTGPLLLSLPAERVLAGVLLDRAGQPLPSARLRIDGDPEMLSNSVPPPTVLGEIGARFAVTDEAGRFRFGRLSDQEYRISWQVGADFVVATVPAGIEDLVLRVGEVRGPHLRFRVRVADALSGRPLSGADVSVMRQLDMQFGSGGMGVGAGRTNAAGHADVVVGVGAWAADWQYSVSAGLAGHAGVTLPAAAYDEGDHELELRLMPERTLQVVVRTAAGAPAPQAAVEVRDGDDIISIRTGQYGAQSPVHTDDLGRVTLPGLPAKVLLLRAWLDGSKVAEQRVNVMAPPAGPVEIILPL